MSEENIYVGAGVRSHRIASGGGRTVCGIDIVKAAKTPAPPGEPGCNRCFRNLQSK